MYQIPPWTNDGQNVGVRPRFGQIVRLWLLLLAHAEIAISSGEANNKSRYFRDFLFGNELFSRKTLPNAKNMLENLPQPRKLQLASGGAKGRELKKGANWPGR